MTQCATLAAPVSFGTTEPPESMVLNDPSVVALIAEVDAILCAAEAPDCQRPTPPVVGCASRRPRCAGRSCRKQVTPRRSQPVRRVDAQQRSPPSTRHRRQNPIPAKVR